MNGIPSKASESAAVELGRYAVFLAVFDAGSFSAAARRPRRLHHEGSRMGRARAIGLPANRHVG